MNCFLFVKKLERQKFIAKKLKYIGMIFVFFLGPPTKPEGPLVVENVTKDQATLKWKEPKDNGGNPVR